MSKIIVYYIQDKIVVKLISNLYNGWKS